MENQRSWDPQYEYCILLIISIALIVLNYNLNTIVIRSKLNLALRPPLYFWFLKSSLDLKL